MTAIIRALLLLLMAAGAGADSPYPPQSLYNLPARLIDQSGVQQGLDVHRGHPVLVSLFYRNCPVACPLIIDTLRTLERSAGIPADLRVLMISIDPEGDTVESLAALAKTRRIDLSRWTLARTDGATVRKIAALLNVQYRRLPDGNFNHSSVITLLTPQGEITRCRAQYWARPIQSCWQRWRR